MTRQIPMMTALAPIVAAGAAHAAVLSGDAAYGDWRTDAPGVVRKIAPGDLPAPFASAPTASPSATVPRPAGARPKAPAGFTVTEFATLDHPRQIRVAPNGDIFVAETDAGRVTILRAADGAAQPATTSAFAEGLDRPFGIAFWPASNPKWVYIANNNTVVRFAYTAGDLKARSGPETIVPQIAGSTGGHTTRDIAVSADGKTLLVSVGSGSNIADGMPKKTPAETAAWAADHALGAAWGKEDGRADVLAFFPDGSGRGVFAGGIRNCVSVTVEPTTGQPWCAVNERDSLGDNLPPDYVTRVKAKAFYGWPWYYIGGHEDPRLKGQRPDLAGKITTPDVLIQPHSAPLGLAFYPARGGVAAFPQEYRGDAFVALHGSWNRAKRTGYKVVRLKLDHGVPDGSYEDFLTGFVADDRGVWGRPVGVAVARDGALLVTDDGGSVVWRVAYAAKGRRPLRLTIAAVLALLASPVLAQNEQGAGLFEDRCAMCHVAGGGGQGPSLAGVVGRRAASLPGFSYTQVLKASGLTWTPANIDRFLTNPAAFVPGTAMPVRVNDAAERAALIRYLATQK